MSLGEPVRASTSLTEECPACERDTPHEVTVELRTENPESDNALFSREPYRVAECTDCGHTTTERMNNA